MKNISARKINVNLVIFLSGFCLAHMLDAPAQSIPRQESRPKACSPWTEGERIGATYITDGVVLQRDFAGAVPIYASLRRENKTSSPPLGILSKLAESIVKIETQASPGSGVIIAADGRNLTILTAGHVTQNSHINEITIQTFDGENHAIRSIHYFPGTDLAELTVDSSQCYKAIPMARSLETEFISRTRKTSIKKDVTILGFPASALALKMVRAKAIIQSYAEQSRAGGYAIIYRYGATGQTEVGMSGSPVLDDNGYVVGIHGQVDRIGRSVKNADVRTGYGLAVPANIWINTRTRESYVEKHRTAVDHALIGAYQLSTGDLNQSIKSLTKAIDISVIEHRSLNHKRSESYQKVIKPSAEDQCLRSQIFQREISTYFGNPFTQLPKSSSQLRQEYDFCVRSEKNIEDLVRRQRMQELADRNTTEHAITLDGAQHHLYMLRSLAYSANGLEEEASKDKLRCLQLARSEADICELPR